MMQQGTPNNYTDHVNKTHNNLGIKNIERLDKNDSNQVILKVTTREKLESKVNAFIRRNKLVLESPIKMERTQTEGGYINGKDRIINESDISIIGFSEIRLKHAFQHNIQSCRLLNPNLVKVTLNNRPLFLSMHHKVSD